MGLYNENVTKIVLSNNQLYLAFFTSTNYIHIVDMESKAIQYSALLPSTGKFMAFSPDNKKLAVKIKDGTVLLIDFNLGSYKVLYKPIQPLEGNEWAKSGDLIFSPNNDIIVSYEKHHIYVCDIQTQSLRTIERKSQSSEIRMSFINDIEFVIDDGEIFICNSVDMSFRKFNNKGSLEHHYLLQYSHYHHGIELYSFKTKQTKIFNTIMGRDVCVSTDGQYIAVSHPVNFLVNIETDSGKSIMLKDHEETSLGLCVDMYFDKSSGMLITKSREISIWDPSSGKEVFSDELKDIIIADKLNCYITLKDGMIRFIDTEPLQKSLDKQRLRFADRTLTANERKKYYLE